MLRMQWKMLELLMETITIHRSTNITTRTPTPEREKYVKTMMKVLLVQVTPTMLTQQFQCILNQKEE